MRHILETSVARTDLCLGWDVPIGGDPLVSLTLPGDGHRVVLARALLLDLGGLRRLRTTDCHKVGGSGLTGVGGHHGHCEYVLAVCCPHAGKEHKQFLYVLVDFARTFLFSPEPLVCDAHAL